MTRLWLVRHGPTHAKAAIGWTDIPADLSDTAAVARLDTHLPRPARLLSSDLVRATATADALAAGRSREGHDAGLREVHFGDWEGQTFADIAAADPEGSRAFWEQPGSAQAPGGESMGALRTRVGGAMERLTGADEDVIAVCHMGAILAALSHATQMDLRLVLRFQIAPLSVTRLTHLGARDGWRVDGVNHVL